MVGVLVEGAREVQEHFRTADGFDLFCRHWKVAGDAERVVVCIHGIGGHSGVFSLVGQDLAEEEIEVYTLDLRGFGNSNEEALPRGDTSHPNGVEIISCYPDWAERNERCLEEIKQFMSHGWYEKSFSQKPYYVS